MEEMPLKMEDMPEITKSERELVEIINISKKDKDIQKLIKKEIFSYAITEHFEKKTIRLSEIRQAKSLILQKIQLLSSLASNRKQDRTNKIMMVLTVAIFLLTLTQIFLISRCR